MAEQKQQKQEGQCHKVLTLETFAKLQEDKGLHSIIPLFYAYPDMMSIYFKDGSQLTIRYGKVLKELSGDKQSNMQIMFFFDAKTSNTWVDSSPDVQNIGFEFV